MAAGQVAGIIALVALAALFAGLIVNHRSVARLRARRDELSGRLLGLEERLGQMAEAERRDAAARRPRRPTVGAPAAPGGVRRLTPPPTRPAPPSSRLAPPE